MSLPRNLLDLGRVQLRPQRGVRAQAVEPARTRTTGCRRRLRPPASRRGARVLAGGAGGRRPLEGAAGTHRCCMVACEVTHHGDGRPNRTGRFHIRLRARTAATKQRRRQEVWHSTSLGAEQLNNLDLEHCSSCILSTSILF
eukprot:scaffold8024_cov101-Isochrysis_galbana.AAC.5